MSAAALVRRALLFARAAPADADEFLALAAIALPVILTYLTGFAQAMIGLILVGHVDAASVAPATTARAAAEPARDAIRRSGSPR